MWPDFKLKTFEKQTNSMKRKLRSNSVDIMSKTHICLAEVPGNQYSKGQTLL